MNELIWALVWRLNKYVLYRVGLRLMSVQRVRDLEQMECEWPYILNRLGELEALEEEREAAWLDAQEAKA